MLTRIMLICFLPTIVCAQTSVSDKPLKEDAKAVVWTKVKPTPITVYTSTDIAGRWRFCHDGTKVTVAPWEASGTTGSRYHIVECESLEHCLKVVAAKKLTIPDDIQRQIDEAQGIFVEPDDAETPQPRDGATQEEAQ